MREIGRDGQFRTIPSLANRVQSLLAMLVFFIIMLMLLSGPAWLPIVIDRILVR